MGGTDVKTSVSVAQQPQSTQNLGAFNVGGGDKMTWVKWVIGGAVLLVVAVAWFKRGKS